jgi:hypothetical protein
MTTSWRRLLLRGVVLIGAVALVILGADPASAALIGRASSASQQATTTSWSATLVDADGRLKQGQPLIASWPVALGTPVYGSVRNTGKAALTGQSYEVTVTGGNTRVDVDACVGANWNTLLGTCAGTTVPLDTSAQAGPTATSTALAVGASISIRIKPALYLAGLTASLTVTTSRANVRAASTINS